MSRVYQAPGVYVEEVAPAARPIAGVGTSTAALIGVVADKVTMPLRPGSKDGEQLAVAPAGEPQLVTSWEEFKNGFGDLIPANNDLDHKVLANAVYGFFNNGGTRCWVLRVEDKTKFENLQEELEKLEAIDEIAIVAAPGALQEDARSGCNFRWSSESYLPDGRIYSW
jgi:uncharacterized protein